jgi:2-methylcitrate dehydratase PrpD
LQPDRITSAVARYIVGTKTRAIPDDVVDEALKCLVDWMGVCIAALDVPEAAIMRKVTERWRARGDAPCVGGGRTTPALAALYNGTLSHCLDYDDTHIPSVVHLSGPAWAAVLAVGVEQGFDERQMLRAFVTGFEVGARLGQGGGIGVRLNQSGWHATAVLGRFGAVAALAALTGLDAQRTAHALALCATQAGGLTASFGTMAKPMHAGKAAMDAILALDLAEAGFTGVDQVLDPAGQFLTTLLQDPDARFAPPDFADWEIRRNSFKPYAACQLAHAAIDAAHRARPRIGKRRVERIDAFVHPLAIKIASKRDARTPTEGKFSTGFCVALGLAGYPVLIEDFAPPRLADPALQEVAARLTMHAADGIERTGTRLEVHLADGEVVVEDVTDAFGSIGNPMDWQALDAKFIGCAEPALGTRAQELLRTLHGFAQRGAAVRAFELAERHATAAGTAVADPRALDSQRR